MGISVWSPASGARFGGCIQGECVSEEQGTHVHAIHMSLYFVLERY